MTFSHAISVLSRSDSSWPDLAEAVAVLASSPNATLTTLALGLPYGGFVAERAALAIFRREGRPIPAVRGQLVQKATDLVSSRINEDDSYLSSWIDLQRYTQEDIVEVLSEDGDDRYSHAG